MTSHATQAPDSLVLGIDGFVYADLFSPYGLRRLHDCWRAQVGREHPALLDRYDAYQKGEPLSDKDLSALLLELAATVSRFLAQLVPDIATPLAALRDETATDLALFRYKDEIIKRQADKLRLSADQAESATVEGEALLSRHGLSALPSERDLARLGLRLLDDDQAAELAILVRWLAAQKQALLDAGHLGFRLPKATDFSQLVPLHRPDPNIPEALCGHEEHQRRRDGFALTDPRKSRLQVLAEVDYCMYCHERSKDSCSKGMRDKNGAVKQNPLGAPLTGCPLGEKISEMHTLRRQ
ncbi:MAG TPA: hypothetical protein PKI49_11585, partial [Pseudomonadota bacterium]|nr:hypothetical protein [Pseudomonadota bacterium]